MAHPCASKNPPSFCNRKAKKRKSSCTCPSGWTAKGIMCTKGRKKMRSSCAATLFGKKKRKKSKR